MSKSFLRLHRSNFQNRRCNINRTSCQLGVLHVAQEQVFPNSFQNCILWIKPRKLWKASEIGDQPIQGKILRGWRAIFDAFQSLRGFIHKIQFWKAFGKTCSCSTCKTRSSNIGQEGLRDVQMLQRQFWKLDLRSRRQLFEMISCEVSTYFHAGCGILSLRHF